MRTARDYFATHVERFINEWKKFLSFKSISADPAYHDDCVACAAWLRSHLEQLGFNASVWPSETQPLVFAERRGNPNKPTVLFYGHYDVQPVDPIDLWHSDPFEATVKDGRMFARGAQDNKGQLFYFIKALEALFALGADLPTIKLLIEGEEESGSDAMRAGLSSWKEPLAADILMVCDTGTVKLGTPTVTMGLRGMAHCEVRVYGPKADVHSGVFGGMILNPLQALVKILSSLHAADGAVAVPGFYDGVPPLTNEDRAMVSSAPINLEALKDFVGVPFAGGERGYTALERRGVRPVLEINGMGGGYQGAGSKTVIPAYAMAKLSMRLVRGQDPDKTLAAVVKHLHDVTPDGVRVEVVECAAVGPALQLSTRSAVLETLKRAMLKEFNIEPAYLWEGASIPIIPLLAETSRAEPLLVGFGQEDDNIHSPNESFSLRQFEEGYRYVTAFLQEL
jgi:acetylornithine deacetylase/succinyl-diaminopimelate desuccinylase-like protein